VISPAAFSLATDGIMSWSTRTCENGVAQGWACMPRVQGCTGAAQPWTT